MNGKHEAIAARLYGKYVEAVGGVAYDGKPLPEWDEFRADPAKRKQSDAWVAVAVEADELLHDS